MTGLVVGTAGHIDHGKTSLVYALTGVDTDRLKEEKQRGISIDLGFAHLPLPDGSRISFVDVPGHERFIRNMLAGAAGIEAVLLIVAANESVMPQTREHFEICRLLGVRHGLTVLTKCDIASTSQVQRTRMDVRQLVGGSFLANSPMLEVSSVTRVGLSELVQQLATMALKKSSRNRAGILRMPIDRSFALKGFGTVVTGTLLSGCLKVGMNLEILPHRQKVRVRGMQSKHAAVQNVNAGERVAVNLTGVERRAVSRGDVLTESGVLACSRVLDVELHWMDRELLPSPHELFVLHLGTAETTIRIHMLSARFARLRLNDEILTLPGDRFVLRRPSPSATVGGGIVIDSFPPLRMNRAKTEARLARLSNAELSTRVEILLDEAPRGLSRAELIRMTGNMPLSSADRLVSRRWIEAQRQALVRWLREFHASNPNAAGASLASARMALEPDLASLVLENFGAIRVEGEFVSLMGHRAQFSQRELAALQQIEQTFRAGGFQPPSLTTVIALTGLDAKKARVLFESLVKSNRLVRLADEVVFHSDVIAHIRNSLAQHKGRLFSVGEFKEWTNISRKFAIPLLEYLDQQHVTKREGDFRVVL